MAVERLNTNPRKAPAGGATLASNIAKERRLRQWAAKIVSDLPSDDLDAHRVLHLAEQLLDQWLPPELDR